MHSKLPPARISENQVDLWCARLPDEWDFRLSQSYRELLTPEETERYVRFVFEKDRRQFLLTRALVRDVLSRYVEVEPSALVFTRNDFGKPALGNPPGPSVSFNLAHTKGMSVCAVVSEPLIGVDVENLQRTIGYSNVARRFFATSEVAFLNRFRGDQKRTEFLRLWTLKEAFVKARGLGLSIPLNSFEIHSSAGQPPYVSFSDGAHGSPDDWQFFQIRLGKVFHVAIALLRPERKPITARVSLIMPLLGMSKFLCLEENRLNEWDIEEF